MDPFEGTEKKLEIIFDGPVDGLRAGSDRWRPVVRASGAEILHHVSTPRIDAYLLSESSLFVWDNRLLMITCGTTTLAAAVPSLFDRLDPGRVDHLFFERKNAFFPGAQPTEFDEDVRLIRDFFPGRSLRLGDAGRDHIHIFWSTGTRPPRRPDTTFQVLMHDLDGAAAADFLAPARRGGGRIERVKGLLPGGVVDEHFFSPQGYSLNAVAGDGYMTVHVTPQAPGSYASFETNRLDRRPGGLLDELLRIFSPRRSCVVLTTHTGRRADALHDELDRIRDGFPGARGAAARLGDHYRASLVNLPGRIREQRLSDRRPTAAASPAWERTSP